MFTISTHTHSDYYDIFFYGAIFLAGLVFVFQAHSRKESIGTWMLIYSSAVIGFMFGAKLFAITSGEWKEVFTSFSFKFSGAKTILGGIPGAVGGILFARKILKYDYPLLDRFAISFPIAMAVQRIGCLFAGCCYGKPTDMPWSLTYLCDNAGADLCTSVPLHPTQLYQSLFCLLIAFVVWRSQKSIKLSGNLFLLSIVLYASVRFFVEFWLDSNTTDSITARDWFGLKIIQWILLFSTIAGAAVIIYRERKSTARKTIAYAASQNQDQLILISILFLVLAYKWFSVSEFGILLAIFLPAALRNHWEHHRHSRSHLLRWSFYAAGVFMFITITVNAQWFRDTLINNHSRNVFNDVRIGFGQAGYGHNHHAPESYDSGCGESWRGVGPYYKHRSRTFAASIVQTRTYGLNGKFTWNVDGTAGWDREIDTVKNTIPIVNFYGHLRYDFKWVGMGLGLHLGTNINERLSHNYYYTTGRSTTEPLVAFAGNLRIFPSRIVYLDIRYNDVFPFQMAHRPQTGTQLAIGSGFGLRNGTYLETGIDAMSGYFASCQVLILNKYGFKGTYYFSKTGLPQFLQVSLSYRVKSTHSNFTKQPAE